MIFSRRSLFAAASGLLLPYEPERVYSFLPAWRLINRDCFDMYLSGMRLVVAPGLVHENRFRHPRQTSGSGRNLSNIPGRDGWCPDGEVWINPANALDAVKSFEAYGETARLTERAEMPA